MNLILLCLLGAIWGTSFLFIKIIVAEIPPLTLVAGRTGFAALILWGMILLRKTPVPKVSGTWRVFAVVGFLNGALPYSLISWGEQFIPSSWAALLQSTTPIFTILAAHFLTLDDRINIKKALGVVLGFSGVGLLMLPELREGNFSLTWGMQAIVGSSISYALASIYARRHLQGLTPMVSSAGQLTAAFCYIVPVSLLFDQPLSLSPSPKVLVSWLALTILGTVLGYNIYYALLKRTNATFTVSVTYIVPLFGLLLGAIFLNEKINPVIILSLVFILVGVLLVRVKEKAQIQQRTTIISTKSH